MNFSHMDFFQFVLISLIALSVDVIAIKEVSPWDRMDALVVLWYKS